MPQSQRYFPWLMLSVHFVALAISPTTQRNTNLEPYLGRLISLLIISPLTHFAVFYLVLQRQKLVMQPLLAWLHIPLIPLQVYLYQRGGYRQAVMLCWVANGLIFFLQIMYMLRQKRPNAPTTIYDDTLLDTPDVFRNNDPSDS